MRSTRRSRLEICAPCRALVSDGLGGRPARSRRVQAHASAAEQRQQLGVRRRVFRTAAKRRVPRRPAPRRRSPGCEAPQLQEAHAVEVAAVVACSEAVARAAARAPASAVVLASELPMPAAEPATVPAAGVVAVGVEAALVEKLAFGAGETEAVLLPLSADSSPPFASPAAAAAVAAEAAVVHQKRTVRRCCSSMVPRWRACSSRGVGAGSAARAPHACA